MLILFFSIYLRWMPPVVWVDFFTDPRRNLTIMLLPALCLGTASAANIARTTRACMLDVLRSEYIRTAAAKGLAGRLVILKHALKNALIPIVTVAGLQIGILLGGTVVVEEVFTLPGIGRLVLWSIYQRDYPLTQSTILFIAVMFMTINLAVDVLYGYLDPRIRYSACDEEDAMRASVLFEQGKPLAVEELELEPPRTGEVRVRMAASGVCHSCLHAADGSWKGVPVPIVLGDEGAGRGGGGRPRRRRPRARRPRDPLVGADVRPLPLLRDRPPEPVRAAPAGARRAAGRHHAHVAARPRPSTTTATSRPTPRRRSCTSRARSASTRTCRSTGRRSSAAR